jgi:hypothetical protein
MMLKSTLLRSSSLQLQWQDEATLAVLQALLARNDADVAVLCETEPL